MVKVERYFGFGAADYEASGGLGDLLYRSDVLEDVIVNLREHKKDVKSYLDEYWIIDMKTLEPVNIEI